MSVFIHCCSRLCNERFVAEVTDKATVQTLLCLSDSPSATFMPTGGQGKFRIWSTESIGDDLHFIALRAVDLH